MHRGRGNRNLPSENANKGPKSIPTLTQKVNFTLLFAILHEIPIAQQDLPSRCQILPHNDSLGLDWSFEARMDAVFFEKCCPKIQFTV